MPIQKPRPLATLALLALFASQAHAETAKPTEPGDAGAYLAAQYASAENDFRAAVGLYDRALATDGQNATLLDGAILANIGIGDIAKAAKLAVTFEALGGKSQQSYLAIMAERAKAGDFAAILENTKNDPGVGALFDGLVKAWAELGNGDMIKALAGFDAVAATPGLESFGLFHKALALASAGDFEGAEVIFSAKKGTQLTLDRRGVLAFVQVLSQLERNPDALSLMDKTFGQVTEPAIVDLRRRLTAGEPIPFDVVRNSTDGIAEVFSTLGSALNGQAETNYVLLYARIANHLRPDNSDAVLLTAEQLEKLGQHDLAAEAYGAITPDDPSYYVAEIGRAAATRAAGRKEAAIEILQALARSHGDVLAVQNALGDGLRRDEHFAEAIKAYDTAVAMLGTPNSSHWSLFYSRGICNDQLKNWDLAESDFRMALKLEPDQPQVLNYLGYSFVDRGINLDEALGMIERAVAARPDEGFIVDSLAWALFRMGRFDEALAPMEKASLLEPVDAIVTDHLGDVYWSVGRKREADFQWRRALSFEPDEADATRIRHKLAVGLDVVIAEEAAAPTPAAEAKVAPVEPATDGN